MKPYPNLKDKLTRSKWLLVQSCQFKFFRVVNVMRNSILLLDTNETHRHNSCI